jgi:glucose/arabinose dehydrogenase/endonuclease YncB( thermonuclease family)
MVGTMLHIFGDLLGFRRTDARKALCCIMVLSALLLLVAVVEPAAAQQGGIKRVPAGGAPPAGSGPFTITGPVRAIDGDTIEVNIDGSRVGVRLIGVDAPRANTECGKVAASQLQAVVREGLRLEEDTGLVFNEQGLRLYYALERNNANSVAKKMVEAGVAEANGMGKETGELRQAEQQARNEKKGCLWSGGSSGNEDPRPTASAQEERPTALGTMLAQLFQRGLTSLAAAADALMPNTLQNYLGARPAQAQSSGGGFVEELVASGLNNPTSFTFLPDGRILIAEKSGIVRVYKNGQLLATPFIDIRGQVNDYWDRGLLGIAADANFATNGYVYLLFTYENDPVQYEGSKTARLIRVTANGDTAAPSSEVVILGKSVGSSCQQFAAGSDCIPTDYFSHSIGNIKAAPDGTLFLTAGDGANFNRVDDYALKAQELDWLGGKVLHITRDGKGVQENPFYTGNADANRSKVWAYGVRNAYRLNLKPNTNIPYLGDVGWGTWEEINVASKGANLGWPCYEGSARQSGYEPKAVCQSLYNQGASAVKAPLVEWNHNGGSAAVTGGVFYTGSTYPAEYRDKYFYGDYSNGWMRYLQVGSNDQLVGSPTGFSNGAGGPVAIEMGSDGNLYYLAINSGQLLRIRYGSDGGQITCPKGQFKAEYYSNQTLTGTPATTRCEGAINYDWGLSEPGTGVGGDNFSVRWSGTHDFAEAGDYTFTATADDGVRVWVDGKLVIDQWKDQGATTYTATVPLTAGEHQIKMEYYENGGGAVAKLSWQRTGGATTCPKGQYRAEYYNGTALNGTPVTTRCEGAINYDWGLSEPGTGVGGDNFSVRWSGTHDFAEAGDYTFTATADDGVRVWVDGKLVIDQWKDQGATTYTATVPLTAGEHQIKMEYYENGGGAVAKLSWQRTGGATNQAPTPTIDKPPSTLKWKVGDTIEFSGSATDPEDGAISASNLNWDVILHHCPGGQCHQHPLLTRTGVAAGSFTAPDHGDAAYFEIVLTATDSGGKTGTARVEVHPQEVQVTLDTQPSGLQVVLDGTSATAPLSRSLIVGSKHTIYAPSPQGSQSFESWSDAGAQQHDVTVGASATTYTAIFKSSGGATTCPKGQFKAEYYGNQTLTGTPVTTRCEGAINYDWGQGGPDTGVGTENFSVRWSGTHDFAKAKGGKYTFTATANDGVRVWVDGKLIIDQWKDQSATTYTATVPLTAGEHQVKMEYYEAGGDAVAKLSWARR